MNAPNTAKTTQTRLQSDTVISLGHFFLFPPAQDLGRDIAQDDTSTGGAPGQMSPLTAAAAGALFGAGM